MVKIKQCFSKQHEFLKVNYGIWIHSLSLKPTWYSLLPSDLLIDQLSDSFTPFLLPGGLASMLKISRKHRTAGSSESVASFFESCSFSELQRGCPEHPSALADLTGVSETGLSSESEAHLMQPSLCPPDFEAPALSHPLLTLTLFPVLQIKILIKVSYQPLLSHHGDPVPRQWAAFKTSSCMLWNDYKEMAYESNQKRVQVMAESLVSKWIVYKWIWKIVYLVGDCEWDVSWNTWTMSRFLEEISLQDNVYHLPQLFSDCP